MIKKNCSNHISERLQKKKTGVQETEKEIEREGGGAGLIRSVGKKRKGEYDDKREELQKKEEK